MTKPDTLRALLECKGANDGGTARDKALRFERLRDESVRLGGVPLIAVLGRTRLDPRQRHAGSGRARLRRSGVLGSNLPELLTVAPFPSLVES